MIGCNHKQIDGLKIFYREAGELEDRFHLIAPEHFIQANIDKFIQDSEE